VSESVYNGAMGEPSDAAEQNVPPAIVRIRYCTQCRWLTRAAWVAQELLTTFPTQIEVVLSPGTGGIFEITLDDEVIFARANEGRFPEPKELKPVIRDRVAPGLALGHSERA
jgi:selenoprotein W-related protein